METSENVDDSNIITAGKYIIINKKDYNKIHLLAENSTVMLGKDKVELGGIIGHPFWSTFRMVQKNSKREYTLQLCERNEIIKANECLKGNVTSGGGDNRNIYDDGSSQLLSTEEIIDLKDKGLSSQHIVETLIENSKTFHSKTEYSQEKYLKKKGTKYSEFLIIKKPTIRIISEILCSRTQTKMLGLRIDSLSQIVTAANIQSDGKYILYENGSQGLVSATILSYLSEKGRLIQITPGKEAQKHAVLAMNLTESQKSRMKCITIATVFQMDSEQVTSSDNSEDSSNKDEEQAFVTEDTSGADAPDSTHSIEKDVKLENNIVLSNDDLTNILVSTQKRKNEQKEYNNAKKPRWELDAEEATKLLSSRNCDGLIIVCKEHPSDIMKKLRQYVSPSRPFVVFNLYREVLTQMFLELRSRTDVVNVKITETWLRAYQVLEGRTHPEVLMSGNSGYLLTGTCVDCPS